ncbi:hypothetical protein TNIN_267211 [Trichonephila inaurata madagascariensis]|uniref:Uncharacterized protein n=1 Tax=Trichonephila inaurata madagascariensis TaxID=2747483 RepID=A0A8X6IFF2_9ARAC|nr:hypothetical protein TNIN_267211 [Trichonephila inaurata madagascariensis]
MFLLLLSLALLNPLLQCAADVDDDALIPYLDDDILGINGNDLDEDMLPPCDLTSYDSKRVNWRIQSNSHSLFLEYDNGYFFILYYPLIRESVYSSFYKTQ